MAIFANSAYQGLKGKLGGSGGGGPGPAPEAPDSKLPDLRDLSQNILPFVNKDAVMLLSTENVQAALGQLRNLPESGKILYLYAVDNDGKLLGVIPTRALLTAPPERQIQYIMQQRTVSIPARATLEDACDLFLLHRYLAFPVVDEHKKLIGTLDASLFTGGMFDIAQTQAVNDAFQLIGVHASEAKQRTVFSGFRDRFPWLLCNVAGGLICAWLSSFYESFLNHAIVLAFFIPVVLTLAESISIQSMSLTLQSFHGTGFARARFFKALYKEFFTASMLGVGCGALVGCAAWFWKGQAPAALAIAASIALAMLAASLIGVLLPSLLKAFRVDPKVAAGPIVLAAADVATLVFFFNLSGWILSK